MRNKCQSSICYRKYLVPYINGIKHSCYEGARTCAQCGNNRFSLDSICPIVKQYREDLKVAVDKALASGVIKRVPPGELSIHFNNMLMIFLN